jgi:hypothetical protein
MMKANHQREFLRAFQGYYHHLEHRKGRATTKAQPQQRKITQNLRLEATPVVGPQLPASLEDVQGPFKQLEISPAYIASAFLHSMAPEINLAERSMAAIDAEYVSAAHCSIGQYLTKTDNIHPCRNIFPKYIVDAKL